MKKLILVLLSLLLLPLSSAIAAAPLPRQSVESFFTAVINGKIAEGYDQLFAGSSIPQDKPQAVASLKQQTQSGLPLYGKISGFEQISEEKFGSSIVRYVYVLKSEKGPTIWEFFFYKPNDSWFLGNVVFSYQFTSLR